MTDQKVDGHQVVKARDELATHIGIWGAQYHPQVVIMAAQHVLAILIAAAPEIWREPTLREIMKWLPENVRHEVAEFEALKEELAADDRKH